MPGAVTTIKYFLVPRVTNDRMALLVERHLKSEQGGGLLIGGFCEKPRIDQGEVWGLGAVVVANLRTLGVPAKKT